VQYLTTTLAHTLVDINDRRRNKENEYLLTAMMQWLLSSLSFGTGETRHFNFGTLIDRGV